MTVQFLHFPPFLPQPIAIAYSFSPAFVLCLWLVWKQPFRSVANTKVAISDHFKQNDYYFIRELLSNRALDLPSIFHPTGS